MSETLKLKPRPRVNWTAQERAEWLALFGKSGQTVVEFCRENELSKTTLSYWLRRERTSQRAQSALVELPASIVSTVAAAGGAVKMHLAGGARVEIEPGTDPLWLGQWLPLLLTGRP
jgi:transposase-like protein